MERFVLIITSHPLYVTETLEALAKWLEIDAELFPLTGMQSLPNDIERGGAGRSGAENGFCFLTSINHG